MRRVWRGVGFRANNVCLARPPTIALLASASKNLGLPLRSADFTLGKSKEGGVPSRSCPLTRGYLICACTHSPLVWMAVVSSMLMGANSEHMPHTVLYTA